MWRGYPVEGYHDTCWLMGLWSTQVKVEGIMLKDSWHWGRDSSVVDDLIGEPGCTPLYVGLLSALGSGNGASLFRRALLGEPGGIQQGSGDGHLFP